MSPIEDGRTTAGAWPRSFTALKPRAGRRAAGVGCLAALGGPMTAFGLWMVAQALLLPHEAETVRLSVVTGVFAALLGSWLLLTVIRRSAARGPAPAQVAVGEGQRLMPGVAVPVRLRQAGPARFGRLTLRVVCERRCARTAVATGPGSGPPSEDVETVWAEQLLDEADVSLARREYLTREATLAIPRIARPSGPTLPSGDIHWYLDLASRLPDGTVVHDVFDLQVVLSDSTANAVQPAAPGAAAPGGAGRTILDRIGPEVGCLVVSVGFLLVGPAFLYLYFSGAPTKRGTPIMGLVAGILFSLIGLIAVWGLVAARRQRPRRHGRRDPRRLP